MSKRKIQPFDSITFVFKILVWTGFFKLFNTPQRKFKLFCFQAYRLFSVLLMFIFGLQHIIFVVQRRDSMDDVFDSLMIGIPQLNVLVKVLSLNAQTTRIEGINKLINGEAALNIYKRWQPIGLDRCLSLNHARTAEQIWMNFVTVIYNPIFSALSKEDEELLLNNNTFMNRMYKIINISVAVSGAFWPLSLYFKRYQDPSAVPPVYMPFDTDTWSKFSMAVFLQLALYPWIGFGHIALDLIVAAYYAQAQVQLKIVKYNLEHMFDADDDEVDDETFRYRDVIDTDLKRRFGYYVERFGKVAWFTNEIGEVFSPSMFFQFFTSSVSICFLVYRMSYTPMGSVTFVFMIFVFFLLSTQILLYCYFGTLVHYESKSLTSSLYLSDWLSVSPKFRRLLLIAMARWSREISPVVAGLIPLTLNTFVSIFKSAYTLYTVLGTTN